MSTDYSRLILGSLIMRPALLESSDIGDGDFPDGFDAKIFRAITEEWENSRPDCIDINCLTAKIGGNGAHVSSLLDGLVKLDDQTFGRYLLEYKKRNAARRLAKALKSELDIEFKTGELCLDKIVPLLDEYKCLENSAANFVPLSEVEAAPIVWLWERRIPVGMLSLLAGAPEAGKSFLSLAMAARLSRGVALPDDGGNPRLCSTLVIASEDPLAQAVRPRAEANGADLNRIFVEKSEYFGEDIGTELRRIRQTIRQKRDIGLIIVDPLNNLMPGRANWFQDPSVRRELLQPLIELAEGEQVSILGIVHLTKAEDLGALARIPGSMAYGAAARSVIGVGLDPDDKDEKRRLVVSVKMNYAEKPDAVAFRIGSDLRVTFEDNPIQNVSADDVLSKRPEDKASRSFADEWLQDQLSNGPAEIHRLVIEAKKVGIAASTLYRIKGRLNIKHRSQGFGEFKKSTWELLS
jgi:hypothetical protein